MAYSSRPVSPLGLLVSVSMGSTVPPFGASTLDLDLGLATKKFFSGPKAAYKLKFLMIVNGETDAFSHLLKILCSL